MSDAGGANVVELTVIRADGLEHHQRRGYFIECSNGVETRKTKTRKQTVKDKMVNWEESLSFTINDGSKFRFSFRVYLKNFGFLNDEKGCADIVLSDCKVDEEIKLRLLNSDQKMPKVTSGVLTIKYKLVAQADVLRKAVHDVGEASQQIAHASGARSDALDKAHTFGSGAKQIASVAETWRFLVENIELFANFVSAISEIHPYAKAALSIVKGVTEIFIAQIKRDDKILDLVGTMNDTYDLIREGDPLANRDMYKKQFNVMALQTLECGYFIQTYVKDSFFKRAVTSLNPRIDKTIENFQLQFEGLMTSFKNHTLLDSTIQVYRVMDAVENLGVTIDLNDITYAEGMRYQGESCCLPETRKDILEMIIKWADDIDSTDGSRVFLLTGLAGSGKSSIAHSVAQHFDNLHRLGSSFFCNRTKAANSRPEKIFCTIARDIADIEGQAKGKLAEVVNSNRSLCKTTSVKEQFNKFLKGSTDGLKMVGPMVIVIDALDECEGDDRLRKELMSVLANEAWTLSKNIRIFLTARSGDPVITNAFKSAPRVRQYSTENIQSGSTNADILVRIENQLSSVADELSEYDIEWREHLMKMAGGLFIWAVTACNLISGSLLGPKSQLREVLSVKRAVDNPLVALYDLYGQVLRVAIDPAKINRKEMDLYRTTLGAILGTFTPLPTRVIEDLTGENCRVVVSRLGAVLTGSANLMQPVEVLHTSFRDYLTDSSLCKAYFVDTREHHSQMAKYCLDMMNRQLKFNVCGFDDIFIFYKDMAKGDLSRRTEDNISEALRYACRHWALHIVQMDPGDYETVEEPLHRFLFGDKHLMEWVEVVSLLQMTDVALKSVNDLVKWFQVNMQNDGETHRMVYDCFRFLKSYSFMITRGPLQVYHSALPYISTRTALYHVYHEISGLEPRVIFGLREEWSSLWSGLQPGGVGFAAAFSPNGVRIACNSVNDKKLRIFDFVTSAPLGKPMECKVDEDSLRYTSLAFSPEGNHLGMSTPEFIEVWNVETRTCVVRDMAFTTKETSIPFAFLSNDCVVACRVNGRGVELWSRSLSNVDPTIHRCPVDEDVRCVAMSLSGRYAGCSTELGNTFVWDTETLEEIVHFKVNEWRDALGISSDGEYIAASCRERVTMWSRRKGEIIWEKECEEYISSIVMPLSTECSHFVTSGYPNYVWDYATGEHYRHASAEVKAVSPDGRYLVDVEGDIYSIEDADRPPWEPHSVGGKAEVNKLNLLEGEHLTHMLFLSDGSICAAGSSDKTVFFFDRPGTVDARKHLLEGHTSAVQDVKISPDGVGLASVDQKKNLFIWTRNTVNMQFELREKLENNIDVDMQSAPDGSLLVGAATVDGAVFVWEQAGKADATKYTLGKHMSNNKFLLFSADGMKVASCSNDNTVIVSARTSRDAKFELLSKNKFENNHSAQEYIWKPSRWVKNDALTNPEEQSSEALPRQSTTNLFFRHERASEWVTTAGKKRLWWIPDGIRGWECTQLGKRIVVYDKKTAVSFTCDDNAIRTT